MVSSSADHYAVLGVSRGASGAALKAAYLGLLRECTPENDPERYMRIAEAYRVLANPELRKDYDCQEGQPSDVRQALANAAAVLEKSPDESVDILEALLEDHPANTTAWFLLGRAYDRLEETDECVRCMRRYAELDNGSANSLLWLGQALRDDGSHREAERVLKELLVKDPKCNVGYLALSWVLVDLGEEERALKTIERGIDADGVVNVDDIPLFVQQVLLLGRLNRIAEIKKTLSRLDKSIPREDREARAHVVASIMPLEAERLDIAAAVVEGAFVFDPELKKDAKLVELVNHARKQSGQKSAGRSKGESESNAATKEEENTQACGCWAAALLVAGLVMLSRGGCAILLCTLGSAVAVGACLVLHMGGGQ
jgi:tetratricopeptide (TPR) repeat protein